MNKFLLVVVGVITACVITYFVGFLVDRVGIFFFILSLFIGKILHSMISDT